MSPETSATGHRSASSEGGVFVIIHQVSPPHLTGLIAFEISLLTGNHWEGPTGGISESYQACREDTWDGSLKGASGTRTAVTAS